MTDLSIARPAQPTLAYGLAGLFGLFTGVCAVFAGSVTLFDWHDEATQARWPVTSAVVDRAEIIAAARGKQNGGSLWNLRTRVHYEVGGVTRTATLTSRTVFSETDAAKLQAAEEQQPRGSRIDIRYDPSRENRAVVASAELSPDRTRTDRILLAGFAIASVGFLALAKYLRARAARAPPSANGAQHARLALGIATAALGLAMTGPAIVAAVQTGKFTGESLMAVLFGLIFVFPGVLICLPPQYTGAKNLLGALTITGLAIVFDWVAFGPGERQFSGSINGVGFVPGELMGRAAFGVFAIILDVCVVMMWIGQCRRMFGAGGAGPGIFDD
ncbi:MAG: DUF3592 domain-containing protein [Bradyrhizobium sp.]|uniref:DUF3592 domain-containing protein n=1 Tax=Bradyrhizobium sp. TaxID=376 RepID=UPI00120447C7|nr:DUF3592 domain-containing protein [Bradyrhizobium sp.]THD64204.1 MAG: DUF3592 domain-containing protein [Bradyrhizobium sp.]